MELDLQCPRCPLCLERLRVVAPDGDPASPVCFVGEAPGQREDQEGRPFVGRAGRMLDRLLAEAGLNRERIMITNTVKCRPPGNRVPRRQEREACFPYLEQELEGKELVVTMGRTASSNLIGREIKLSEDANVIVEVELAGMTLRILPTFHPAACLFNLEAREGLRRTVRLVKDSFF